MFTHHLCACVRVHVIIYCTCAAPPPLRMSVTASFRFAHPHPASRLSCSTSISSLISLHLCSIDLLRRPCRISPCSPPISDSSLSYITTHFPSHKPPNAARAICTPAITEKVCSTDVKLSSLFLASSLLPSLSLPGPGRLRYALITLSILPSCQPPCSGAVTAQGHHGSIEEQ